LLPVAAGCSKFSGSFPRFQSPLPAAPNVNSGSKVPVRAATASGCNSSVAGQSPSAKKLVAELGYMQTVKGGGLQPAINFCTIARSPLVTMPYGRTCHVLHEKKSSHKLGEGRWRSSVVQSNCEPGDLLPRISHFGKLMASRMLA
jgi:hypothetical protein